MKNFTFHKGPLSDIKNVTKAFYVNRNGYPGGVIKKVESGLIVYELHIESPDQPCKLTSITSSLWEMRRDLIKENTKQVAIEKHNHLHGNLTWDDIKKCLIETFKGTNIKVIICEF